MPSAPAPPTAPAPWRRPIAVIALVLAICAGAALLAWHEADRLKAAAMARADATAEGMAQSLARSLEGIAGLHRMAETRHRLLLQEDRAGAAAVEALMAEAGRGGRFGALHVSVADAEGWLAWISEPQMLRLWLGDRSYVRAHLQGVPGAHASAPTLGRVTGRYAFKLSRPITDAEGRFGGVAIVSLDSLAMGRGMARLHAGAGDGSALVRLDDGSILALGGERAEAAFGSERVTDGLRALLAGAPAGLARPAPGVLREGDRAIAFRRLEEPPLAVAVSVDLAEAAAPAWHLGLWSGLGALAASALLLFGVAGRRRPVPASAALARG